MKIKYSVRCGFTVLVFLLFGLASACVFAGEEEMQFEDVLLPEEDVAYDVWQRHGPLQQMITTSRTGRVKHEYNTESDRIVESIFRWREDRSWRHLPLTINYFDSSFHHLLRSEYAFDEDGVALEWIDYDYKDNVYMGSKTYRSSSTGGYDLLRRKIVRRDSYGRVSKVLTQEDGQTYEEETHRYEFDEDTSLWHHRIQYLLPSDRHEVMVMRVNGTMHSYQEYSGDTLVYDIEYDFLGHPTIETDYESDGVHFNRTVWDYRKDRLYRKVTDFSKSSFPALQQTRTYYFYRFGKLYHIVKTNADDVAMEKIKFVYVNEYDSIGFQWTLPDQHPSWWWNRPSQVIEYFGTTRKQQALHWTDNGCDIQLAMYREGSSTAEYTHTMHYDADRRLTGIQTDTKQAQFEYSPHSMLPGFGVTHSEKSSSGFSVKWVRGDSSTVPAMLKYVDESANVSVLQQISVEKKETVIEITVSDPYSEQRTVHRCNEDGLLLHSLTYWKEIPIISVQRDEHERPQWKHFRDVQGKDVVTEHYQWSGRLLKVKTTTVIRQIDWRSPGEYTTRYHYDSQGRLSCAEEKREKGIVTWTLQCEYSDEE